MEEAIPVFESFGCPCPYLPGRTWSTLVFGAEAFPPASYERLLSQGFRRSGSQFYRNRCPGCSLCIPIRVRTAEFLPSKSQRRCLRRNEDIRLSFAPAGWDDEVFDLYRRYCAARHDRGEADPASFEAFLAVSPVTTLMTLYREGGNLVGVGWIDILVDGWSTVYFAFDPSVAHRGLGTYSILREIQAAREAGKTFYHLGFWVPGSRKMDYKAAFRPHEILLGGTWVG